MSFFTQSDTPEQITPATPEGLETGEEPSKIKIGSEEYDAAEAERLMNLGKIAHEAETKYNTKIDRVWPQYQRTQNEIEKLKEEIEGYRSQPKQVTPEQQDRETQIAEARKAARELGIVTQDELDSYYRTRKAEDDLIGEIKGLQSKINGSDGRPAFDPEEIIYHMRETGITNPEKAYKDRYEKELDEWRVNNILKEKRGGFYTAPSSAPVKTVTSKAPQTKEELHAALLEHFTQANQ